MQLVPLHESHTKALVPIAADPFIWRYLLEDGSSQERLFQYIQTALDQRNAGVEYPFVIYDKIQKRPVGTTRIYELNAALQTTKIGHTWYGAAYRGSGVNARVKYLLFEYLFDRLKMMRIGFGVHELNQRSIAGLLKLGIKKEGLLREFLPNLTSEGNKNRCDIVLFSVLKKEWEKEVKGRLTTLIAKPIAL